MCEATEEERELVIKFHKTLDPYRSAGLEAVDSIYHDLASTYDEMARIIEIPYGSLVDKLVSVIGCCAGEVKIIDIGCGTGLLGVELKKRGFNEVDGLDLNRTVLNMAALTGAYKNCIHAAISSEPLPGIDDNTYDVAVSIASFVEGHVPMDSLYELSRIVKPQGHILILLHDPNYTMDYMSWLGKLMKENKVELLEMVRARYKREYRIDFNFVYGYFITLKVK